MREDCPDFILSGRGWLKFPIYWQSHPSSTSQKKLEDLESWEQHYVAILEAFPLVSTGAVLECRDPVTLSQYFGNELPVSFLVFFKYDLLDKSNLLFVFILLQQV